MLINVPYKKGDVVSIKLASGEEVLGTLEEEKGDSLIVSKPRMIAAMEQGIGLAPFMFSVNLDGKCEFKAQSILCITKTEEGFARQYTQHTTGIQV